MLEIIFGEPAGVTLSQVGPHDVFTVGDLDDIYMKVSWKKDVNLGIKNGCGVINITRGIVSVMDKNTEVYPKAAKLIVGDSECSIRDAMHTYLST